MPEVNVQIYVGTMLFNVFSGILRELVSVFVNLETI